MSRGLTPAVFEQCKVNCKSTLLVANKRTNRENWKLYLVVVPQSLKQGGGLDEKSDLHSI
jgi:hypothetical protein